MTIRCLILPLAIVSAGFVVPAVAQDGAPPAGRYELSSGPDNSFVRLDTRTGAVSHCRQERGVWRCEPIMDSGLGDRLTGLSDKVDRLASDVDRLSRRVDRLAAGVAAPAAGQAAAAEGTGKRKGFAQSVVTRLLDMVRTLKHGGADQT